MQTGSDGLKNQDFSTAYDSLCLFPSGPLSGQGTAVDCQANGARFDLPCDVSPLFPFINAVADRAHYLDKPDYIRFIFEKRLCAFYPDQGAFTPVCDMADALAFLPRLLDFIRDVYRRRDTTRPNPKRFRSASAVDIFRLLPGSNCGRCGFPTCIAFSAALSRQRTSMNQCPYLGPPMAETATYPVFDDKGKVIRTVSLPIDTTGLTARLDQGEQYIQSLEAQLSAAERDREADIETANRRLPAALSRREIEVLGSITRGATNREISAKLNISPHTVKSHVIHIFNKIGVNDRAQAAAWGARHGVC